MEEPCMEPDGKTRMRVYEQFRPSVDEINIMAQKIRIEYPDPVIAREMLSIWVDEETSSRIAQEVKENGL